MGRQPEAAVVRLLRLTDRTRGTSVAPIHEENEARILRELRSDCKSDRRKEVSRKKYTAWTRVPWDGNPALGYECWRKSFGRGDVSVGIGDFLHVIFDYGPNSDYSIGSTRWDCDRKPISERDMMRMIDKANGKHHNMPLRAKAKG